MTESPLTRLLRELKGRHVFRVAAMYAVVAWLAVEVTATVAPLLLLPEWVPSLVVVLALVGFPVAVVLAWAFEVTPEGVRRTEAAEDVTATSLPPAWVWLGGVAVVGGSAAWMLGGLPGSDPDEPVEARAVAVLPFTVRGDPGLHYLSEGLVDLLTRNLDGAAELRGTDPGTVIRIAGERADSAPLSVVQASTIAQRVGASFFVLGGLTESAGRLRAHAQLYHRTDPTEPAAEADVEADASELFELVDRLTAELLTDLIGPASGQLARTAARTTSSLPALKAYLEGELALGRQIDMEPALAAYRRAVTEDSTFALAWYRLAVASLEATHGLALDVGAQGVERAIAHADRLGERDRRLVEAYVDFWYGRPDAAEARYRELIRDYPENVDARFRLGQTQFRYNPLRGRPASESRSHFLQVVARDPGFLCPL